CRGAGADGALGSGLCAVDQIRAACKEPKTMSLQAAGRLHKDLDLRRPAAVLREPLLQPLYLRLRAAEVPLIGQAPASCGLWQGQAAGAEGAFFSGAPCFIPSACPPP